MYEVTGREEREEDDFLRTIVLWMLAGGIQGGGGTPSSATPVSGGGPNINLDNLATTALFAETFSHDRGLHDILLPLILIASGGTQAGGTQPNLLFLLPFLRGPRFHRRRPEAFHAIEEGEQDKSVRWVQEKVDKLITELSGVRTTLDQLQETINTWRVASMATPYASSPE